MNNNALDLLSKMHTVSIDLETTGIKPSDQIWSGGFYSVKDGTVLNEHQSFFDIKTPTSYGNLTSETDLTSILENAHSSKTFGARQAGKGTTIDGNSTANVLSDWATAVRQGTTESTSDFVSSLTKELEQHNAGSVLLLQNVNFEDRVLSKAYASKELPALPSLTNKLLDKGLAASSDPRFGESFERFFLPKEIFDMRALQSASYRSLKDSMASGSDLKGHLHNYYKTSMDIVDKYASNAARAQQEGKVAVVDLMDLTKALYAHGAVSGQVKPEMLSFGSKVDTLSRALLQADEKHAALSDAIQQQEIYKKVVDELKVIKEKGSTYQSPLVESLVKQMEKDKTYSTQLKDRHFSVVREYLENTSNITRQGLEDRLEKRFMNGNRHLIGITKEDFNLGDFYEKFKAEARGFFNEDGSLNGSAEEVTGKLEDFTSKYKTSDIDLLKRKLTSNKLESFLSHRATKWGAATAGTLLGASMLFGGNREEQKAVKYDTYDELYNNQYYGSAFADWQNRNNSHKMQ